MKQRLAVGLVVATVLLLLGGMWWWALFGIAEDVGDALYVTGLVFGCSAFGFGAWHQFDP